MKATKEEILEAYKTVSEFNKRAIKLAIMKKETLDSIYDYLDFKGNWKSSDRPTMPRCYTDRYPHSEVTAIGELGINVRLEYGYYDDTKGWYVITWEEFFKPSYQAFFDDYLPQASDIIIEKVRKNYEARQQYEEERKKEREERDLEEYKRLHKIYGKHAKSA